MARKPTETLSSASTDFVTVACKLPQGLHIHYPASGINVKLNGAHSAYQIGGHGLTQNVPAAVWARIEEIFAEAKWLTNESVFAMNKPKDANAKAKEQHDNVAGFERIDPNDPNSKLKALKLQDEGAPDLGMNS